MNYGLRYEYYSAMRERDNRAVLFNLVTGQLDYPSKAWYKSSKLNFAPRLGLSWAPEKLHNKTVFRFGDKRNGNILTNPVVANGQVMTEAIINVPGGGVFAQCAARGRGGRGRSFITGADKRVYLNPAAFAIPQPGTFGNMGRNALAGPDLSQFDLTLHKRITLTEKVNLQFRGEIYNFFNRANLTNPPATLSAGLPGSYSDPANAAGLGGIQPGKPFTASAAGGAFGRFNSTVANTVGLGAQRQIQLSLRLNF